MEFKVTFKIGATTLTVKRQAMGAMEAYNNAIKERKEIAEKQAPLPVVIVSIVQA